MKKPPKHKTRRKRTVAVAALPRSRVGVNIGRTTKAITHLLAPGRAAARRGTPTGLSAREIAVGLIPQDRQLVALLLAPFVIMTMGLSVSLALKERLSLKELIAQRPPIYVRSAAPPLTALPFVAATAVVESKANIDRAGAAQSMPTEIVSAPLAAWQSASAARVSDIALHSAAPDDAHPSALPRAVGSSPGELASVRSAAVDALSWPASRGQPGVVLAAPLALASEMHNFALSPITAELSASEADFAPLSARPSRCSLAEVGQSVSLIRGDQLPGTLKSTGYGTALARAAESQTADLVVYNDSYRQISYPLGDVPALFGVCTDVVIRAYRTLGVDLQALVHQARGRSSDPSIDHRRVETLRRFFAVYGDKLPASDFADDYWPGDIVTYNRPQNRHGQSHIAIVADRTGPSGRPMIVHNRGWGPQLEDALFVDEITGHYRYAPAAALIAEPAEPAGAADIEPERTMARGIARLKRAAIAAKSHAAIAAKPGMPAKPLSALAAKPLSPNAAKPPSANAPVHKASLHTLQ